MGNKGQRVDNHKLVTPAEFAAVARVHRSTIERWRFEGHGPKPVKLGPRTVRYKRSDVDRFTGGTHTR